MSKLTTNTFILQIWAPEPATEELVRKQELLRERFILDGHSESFSTPFNREVTE